MTGGSHMRSAFNISTSFSGFLDSFSLQALLPAGSLRALHVFNRSVRIFLRLKTYLIRGLYTVSLTAIVPASEGSYADYNTLEIYQRPPPE